MPRTVQLVRGEGGLKSGGPGFHPTDRNIVCPWHGSWFSADSGEVLRGPSAAPLPCYQARLVDGTVEVRERAPEQDGP